MAEAQDLLDELHLINISAVFALELGEKERGADIKVLKQKLKLHKRKIAEGESRAKAEWDARKGDYEKAMQAQAIAPFTLLSHLIEEVEISLEELENAVKFNRDLPMPPTIGTVIITTEQDPIILTNQEAIDYCAKKNQTQIAEAKKTAARLKREMAEIEEKPKPRQLFYAAGKTGLKSEMVAAKQSYLVAQFFMALQEITGLPVCSDYLPPGFTLRISSKAQAEAELANIERKRAQLLKVRAEIEELPEAVHTYCDSWLTNYASALERLREYIQSSTL